MFKKLATSSTQNNDYQLLTIKFKLHASRTEKVRKYEINREYILSFWEICLTQVGEEDVCCYCNKNDENV